ncbi:MAG: NfeD family protein [Chitinophagales bacterium]
MSFKLLTKKTLLSILLVHMLLLCSNPFLLAEENTEKSIYHFRLDADIFPAAERTVKNALEEADSQKSDWIVMELNTFGGMVDVADKISRAIQDSKIPVVVWINKNAASAGALISLSCDSIFMAPGSSIGAATVVNQTGEQMPDKYQSYMRSTMRSLAESSGRDPKIAEAMVDDRVHIPGVIDSGYTLTFTTEEAIANGFCEAKMINKEAVFEHIAGENYRVNTYEAKFTDKVISWLTHPMVSSVLILLMLGGIWFELQSPGLGFPIVAALVGAVLFFMPHYLEGLAENWEILLFVGGIALLGVEIFVLPGFGIAGIAGIGLIVFALTMAMVRNIAFDFHFAELDDILFALLRVVGIGGVLLTGLLFFGDRIFKGKLFAKLILQSSQYRSEGYTSYKTEDMDLIGRIAIAATDIRPTGKIKIDGRLYNAITDGEIIDKGTEVKVMRINASLLEVIKTSDVA